MENQNKFFAALKPLFVTALKTLLKVSGFRGWLVGLLAKEFYDDIALPIMQSQLMEHGYRMDVRDGRKMLTKIQEATNAQEYDDAVDDVLGGRR